MGRYDVYVPMSVSALRPSKVQQSLIDQVKDGARLIGTFDVYGGYDWHLIRKNGMTSDVSRATMQGLLDRGLITKGETVRVYSGRHETPFTLTEKAAP